MHTSVVSHSSRLGAVRRAAAAAALLVAVTGCSTPANKSDTSSYLVLLSLTAASGADSGSTFSSTLASDVLTFGAAYSDPAVATFQLSFKDPGTAPTPINFITIKKYSVRYLRNGGGPVPDPFEGAATFTVTDAITSSGPITLVRAQAKTASPLSQLAGQGGTALPVTAEVTFSGTDQTGKDISVTGSVGINFADWLDPGVDPTTPAASFTILPASGVKVNVAANFDASASVVAAGRTIVSYAWSFGDGGSMSGVGAQTTHVFGSTGVFTIRLTVTDSAGQTYVTERTITVSP